MVVIDKKIGCNLEFLRSLAGTSSAKKRRALIEKASIEELLCLVEIATNVVKGRFPLRPLRVNKLREHAPVLRRLSRVRTPGAARRLVQSGEGLSAVVPLIVPIIAHLLLELKRNGA